MAKTLINEPGASLYESNLKELAANFVNSIKQRDAPEDLYETFLNDLKEATLEFNPDMEKADVSVVLQSIRDVSCTVLRDPDLSPKAIPIIPNVDIPTTEQFIKNLNRPVSSDLGKRIQITFEHIAEAHDAAATACRFLADLSTDLTAPQFMTLAKMGTLPPISLQIPTQMLEQGTEPPKQEEEKDAKATRSARIIKEMLPRPNLSPLRHEPPETSTRNLAALTFHLLKLNLLEKGSQKESREYFDCHPKVFQRVVTGKKYYGGKGGKGGPAKQTVTVVQGPPDSTSEVIGTIKIKGERESPRGRRKFQTKTPGSAPKVRRKAKAEDEDEEEESEDEDEPEVKDPKAKKRARRDEDDDKPHGSHSVTGSRLRSGKAK